MDPTGGSAVAKRKAQSPESGDPQSDRATTPTEPLANLYRIAVADQFSRLEDDPALPNQEKLLTLYAILTPLVSAIDRLSRTAPDRAPELWEDRVDKSENAYDFTRRVYRDYIERGLSKPDIFSLDPKLYQAIHDRRRRSKDNSLVLRSKREVTDVLLASLGPNFSLSDILNTIPRIFRRQVSLYSTASTRRHRSKAPLPR
jgi:hypothetical protein